MNPCRAPRDTCRRQACIILHWLLYFITRPTVLNLISSFFPVKAVEVHFYYLSDQRILRYLYGDIREVVIRHVARERERRQVGIVLGKRDTISQFRLLRRRIR
jgi:hypothetical protein